MLHNLCLFSVAYMRSTSQTLEFVNPVKNNENSYSILSQGARAARSPDQSHRGAGRRSALPSAAVSPQHRCMVL